MSTGVNRTVHAEPLAVMRKAGGTWFAYENHDLGHPGLGHLQFLKCGEGCTFAIPPKTLPDTPKGINWRYQLIGSVNLETGMVICEKDEQPSGF